MLSGAILQAHDAERIGLVSKVVPDAELRTQTDLLLDQMTAASPLGLQGMKHLARIAATTDLVEGLRIEREYVLRYATTSADATEGLLAFVDKRAPRFTGS
jgi:enoyl-CoA hydratase